jgi:hypothetical protein
VIAIRSTTIPTNRIENNVVFNSLGSLGTTTPIAIEMQGAPQIRNNLVQGDFCHAVAYGNSFGGAAVTNNTFQGHYMSTGAKCLFGKASLYNIENATTTPMLSGNETGETPSAIASSAPTISPASGNQIFPLEVTFTDSGRIPRPVPQGNTGIWYTTDGSTPVPGSGTARYIASGGKIRLPEPATVKAVGMWGTPPQPTSYPPGYGFVPSGVITVEYASGAAGQKRGSR